MDNYHQLHYDHEVFKIAHYMKENSEEEAFAILAIANQYCEDIFYVANDVCKKRKLLEDLTNKLNNNHKGDHCDK